MNERTELTGQESQVTPLRSRSVTIRVAWPLGQGQSLSGKPLT
ncbi:MULTISPECIES: hypothetical protein [unclassified Moorena]|nr:MULTISPECIES: hypothetical protein [unclassified Moorena]